MTQVKIGETLLDARINGTVVDKFWGGRESKSITLSMSYSEVNSLFVDNCIWSIIQTFDPIVNPETGETVTPDSVEYDNSEYSVAGPITDNRDGTVTVKMGKPTEFEIMQKQLANAVTQEELTAAYVEGVNSL